MNPETLQDYRTSFIKRSADDDFEEDSDDASAYEDFFKTGGNKSGETHARGSRQHGDDLIYKEMGSTEIPHYSRYSKAAESEKEDIKVVDPKTFSNKYKANIVPTHLKKTRNVDKSKSLYGLSRTQNVFQNTQFDSNFRENDSSSAASFLSTPHEAAANYSPPVDSERINKQVDEIELNSDKEEDNQKERIVELETIVENLNESLLETKAKNLNLQKQVISLTSERQKHLEQIDSASKTMSQLRLEQRTRNVKADALQKKILSFEEKMNRSKETSKVREDATKELKNKVVQLEAMNAALRESMNQLKTAYR